MLRIALQKAGGQAQAVGEPPIALRRGQIPSLPVEKWEAAATNPAGLESRLENGMSVCFESVTTISETARVAISLFFALFPFHFGNVCD